MNLGLEASGEHCDDRARRQQVYCGSRRLFASTSGPVLTSEDTCSASELLHYPRPGRCPGAPDAPDAPAEAL
jgi:hypothetical protein